MLRSVMIPPLPQVMKKATPIRINLSRIEQGQIKIVVWNHQNIAILHRTQLMQSAANSSLQNSSKTNDTTDYFVFINRGGDLNCPLRLDLNQTYLQDSCSGYLYYSNGKAVKPSSRIHNLLSPPHHFIDQNHLIIGEN